MSTREIVPLESVNKASRDETFSSSRICLPNRFSSRQVHLKWNYSVMSPTSSPTWSSSREISKIMKTLPKKKLKSSTKGDRKKHEVSLSMADDDFLCCVALNKINKSWWTIEIIGEAGVVGESQTALKPEHIVQPLPRIILCVQIPNELTEISSAAGGASSFPPRLP